MGKPVNSLASPRFCGVRTFQRLPFSRDLAGNDFGIVGVPFDTATTYKPGCRFGPASIRDASSILKSYHSVLDVDIFDHCEGIDYGDIDIIPGHIDESYERIEAGIDPFTTTGVVPIVLGGDHSITLPILRSLHKKYGPMALVHFDAHSDTGSDYFGKPYNHGTTFHWAIKEKLISPEHSTQMGIRGPLYAKSSLDFARESGMQVIPGWDLHAMGMDAAIKLTKARLAPNMPVFISFDIDFLDAAYAPGTGTPEIGGFTSHEALYLMLHIGKGCNLIGMDMVEVLPESDPAAITSFAAAGIIHTFISLLAYNKQQAGTASCK